MPPAYLCNGTRARGQVLPAQHPGLNVRQRMAPLWCDSAWSGFKAFDSLEAEQAALMWQDKNITCEKIKLKPAVAGCSARLQVACIACTALTCGSKPCKRV